MRPKDRGKDKDAERPKSQPGPHGALCQCIACRADRAQAAKPAPPEPAKKAKPRRRKP